MVYKKFVNKNGKLHGPYYYESYRQGNTVKKVYIGGEQEYQNWLKKNSSNAKPSANLLAIFLVVVALLVVIAGVVLLY